MRQNARTITTWPVRDPIRFAQPHSPKWSWAESPENMLAFRGQTLLRYSRPLVAVSVLFSAMGATMASKPVTSAVEIHAHDKAVEVIKSDVEWRSVLTPKQYHVTREKGTERPWESPLNHLPRDSNGDFLCIGCGQLLFK